MYCPVSPAVAVGTCWCCPGPATCETWGDCKGPARSELVEGFVAGAEVC